MHREYSVPVWRREGCINGSPGLKVPLSTPASLDDYLVGKGRDMTDPSAVKGAAGVRYMDGLANWVG
jgi:hypothetical protein